MALTHHRRGYQATSFAMSRSILSLIIIPASIEGLSPTGATVVRLKFVAVPCQKTVNAVRHLHHFIGHRMIPKQPLTSACEQIPETGNIFQQALLILFKPYPVYRVSVRNIDNEEIFYKIS